jgi:hypothetical protein
VRRDELDVPSKDVVNAADGWSVSEAAMWPAVVVADESSASFGRSGASVFQGAVGRAIVCSWDG